MIKINDSQPSSPLNLQTSKNAFTLAEVMIVLTVIGILVAILLPTAQNLTPDEALMKFQKNNVNLANAIRNLSNSEEYYYNGDFGLDRDNNPITEPKYFCSTLADMLGAKRINCSEDNLGYNTSALANLADMLTYEMQDGTPIYDYADCICKNHTTSGEEIILNDGTIIYTINPYYHFGSKVDDSDKRLFNLCSKEKRYKFICMDIDGIGKGNDPFGYAIRADGRIIYGSRAQAWVDRKINDKNETPTISSIDSCELTALSITPEEDTCVAPPVYTPTVTPTPEPTTPCTNADCGDMAMCIEMSDTKAICMTKYNIGDTPLLPIASGVTIAEAGVDTCTPSETNFCCWQGETATDCDAENGGYSGCTRTVCDWRAGNESCNNLSYNEKTWRLPTIEEWNAIGEQINSVSIGQGSNGLMLCDYANVATSSYCNPGGGYCLGVRLDTCDAYVLWGSEAFNVYWLNNNSLLGPEYHEIQAYSVRCVSDL